MGGVNVIPGDTPYAEAINALAAKGFVGGFEDKSFRPDKPVTRQQFAKMIVLTLGINIPDRPAMRFRDVDPTPSPGDPLYPAKYVAACAESGITTGKTVDSFDPQGNITRLQVISMVMRGIDKVQPGLPEPRGGAYTWGPGISKEHGLNAMRAEHNGLLAGLPLQALDPFGPMPRGEVAQVLHNMTKVLRPR